MSTTVVSPAQTGYPVASRPIAAFTWLTGEWFEVFERQVDRIQAELARAHQENRIIVYLSCPISSLGGGHFATNVEIADFTAQRLRWLWGDRIYVLNPAAHQHQLASEAGTPAVRPGGGDYMRMWTRVLVEDDYLTDPPGRERRGRQLGGLFDAFYFLGPGDVHDFFVRSYGDEAGITAAVEAHFAGLPRCRRDDRSTRRREYVRYYTVRAGASASLGSRDEWNIFTGLNLARTVDPEYGPGELIAGFYDGRQLTPADTGRAMPAGYEVVAASVPEQGRA